jgi:hypothetical protein
MISELGNWLANSNGYKPVSRHFQSSIPVLFSSSRGASSWLVHCACWQEDVLKLREEAEHHGHIARQKRAMVLGLGLG